MHDRFSEKSLTVLAAGLMASFAEAQVAALTVHGASAGDRVGVQVAVVADAHGDGYEDFAVGSPGPDLTGVDAGRLRVYSGVDEALLQRTDPPPNTPVSRSLNFGTAAAIALDLDGGGRGNVATGAPNPGNKSGRAQIDSGATGLPLASRVSSAERIDDDYFKLLLGAPVDPLAPAGAFHQSGNRVLAGAPDFLANEFGFVNVGAVVGLSTGGERAAGLYPTWHSYLQSEGPGGSAALRTSTRGARGFYGGVGRSYGVDAPLAEDVLGRYVGVAVVAGDATHLADGFANGDRFGQSFGEGGGFGVDGFSNLALCRTKRPAQACWFSR